MGKSRRRSAALALSCGIALLAVAGCGRDEGEGHATDHPPTLFLAGDGELWVVDADAETSQQIRMPELSPGDAEYRVVARGDRLVLWGYDTYTLDPSQPSLPPDVLARDSWIFIPSDEPDRVWIGFLDPRSPATERGLTAVREVAVDGDITVQDVPPPGGAWPAVAFEHGLLFLTREGSVLWDPATQEVLRRFDHGELGDGQGPSHRDLLLSCPDGCRELWLTSVVSGDRRTIPAPDGVTFEVWSGAFSPDGTTIAVPVVAAGSSGWDAPHQLALVSPDSGEVKVVPGSTVPGGYVSAVWTTSGEDVFLTGGERGEPRVIAAYHRGDERAQRLDVNVGDFYDAAAW